jgi:hypothetical protein
MTGPSTMTINLHRETHLVGVETPTNSFSFDGAVAPAIAIILISQDCCE